RPVRTLKGSPLAGLGNVFKLHTRKLLACARLRIVLDEDKVVRVDRKRLDDHPRQILSRVCDACSSSFWILQAVWNVAHNDNRCCAAVARVDAQAAEWL